MIEIEITLFGLGHKAAGIEKAGKKFRENETLFDLWQLIKAEAKPDSTLAQMTLETILVLKNGKPFHGEDNLRATIVSDGDKVTFLRPVLGG